MIKLKPVCCFSVLAFAALMISTPFSASFSESVALEPPQTVDSYYSDVKGAYKQAAKMMGRAKTDEKKKQVISLQRTCSTSLGGLRKESKKGAKGNLVKAQKLHATCMGALAKAK